MPIWTGKMYFSDVAKVVRRETFFLVQNAKGKRFTEQFTELCSNE